MSDFRFGRMRYIPPAELGFNAVLQTAATTGSTFDATGCNRLTLMVVHTNADATGDLDLTVEAYDPGTEGWVVLNAVSVSAGIQTLTNGTLRKASAGISQSYEIRLTDLFFGKMRVKAALMTAASTDTLSIGAYLGYGA